VKRNRRAAVEDLWMKTVRDENGNRTTVPSASHGKGSRWRARYVDGEGREHAKQFKIKAHAQRWLDQQTSAVVQGNRCQQNTVRANRLRSPTLEMPPPLALARICNWPLST
jgi:hypothetical protein